MSAVINTDPITYGDSAGRSRNVPGWLVLALVCAGQFMVILDASIVNVALPSIRAGLGFTPTGLQWVVNAYLLTFGGFLLLGGRTADLFGRRRMLNVGLVLFSAASLVCGVADAPGVLVAARAVQGLGAAILAPAVLAVLTTRFTAPAERARALSIWTAVGALGGVMGTIAGGAITAAWSWRWIFLVNVPVGIVLIVVAMLTLVARDGQATGGLDLPGAICATAGMTALTFGIVQTGPYGWTSAHVLVPTLVGIGLLGMFGLIEGRVAKRPMLPLRLFRSGAVAGGTVLLILIGATSIASWYFSSLFLQNVLDDGPMAAGLALAPAAFALVVTAMCVSPLMARTGARPLIWVGCLCHVVGFGWLAAGSTGTTYLTGVLGPTVLVATGIGLIFTPTPVAVTSRVTRPDAGVVSGLANAARQAGGSFGLAVLATAAGLRTNALLGGAGHPGLRAAVASCYDLVFVIAAGTAVVTALISLILPGNRGRKRTEPREHVMSARPGIARLFSTGTGRRAVTGQNDD